MTIPQIDDTGTWEPMKQRKKTPSLKAYSVSDKNGDVGIWYVIFATTRGKAIRYALDHCDGAFDWYAFTEMRALRKPALDRFFRGETAMDWCDMRDRVAMVRYAGFRCSDEVLVTSLECAECPAHEWCERYESMTD